MIVHDRTRLIDDLVLKISNDVEIFKFKIRYFLKSKTI